MIVQAVATVALAPLLLAQGRRVRRTTPRLPEAAGPREGVVEARLSDAAPSAPSAVLTGSAGPSDPAAPPGCSPPVGGGVPPGVACPAPLHLLIAGDSSAAGVGVPMQADALAGLLPRRLAQATGRPVHWRLAARTGADIAQLVDLLGQVPAGRLDAVVIAIGANEATARTSPARWRARLDALDAVLQSRFGRPATLICALPPMHRFPALPQPLRWYLGRQARLLDAALAEWAAMHAPRVRRVASDLSAHGPIGGDASDALIASDGFHPGPRAYRLWAGTLSQALLGTLAPREAAQR